MMHGLFGGGMWGWGMWLGMVLLWLVPLALVVALFWGILRRSGDDGERQESDVDDTHRAMAVLKERYARGELSREEFQQMKDDLRAP